MRDQLITEILEKIAALHVKYLKTGEGCSVITHLSKIESRREGNWRALAATEAAVLSVVCKRIFDELDKND